MTHVVFRRRRRIFGRWQAAVLLWLFGAGMLGSALAQSEPYIPIETIPHLQVSAFASVGLARGQTARLSVVNASGTTGCTVELAFLDEEGRLITSSREHVESGKTRSLDLNRDKTPAAEARVQARAVVNITTPIQGTSTCVPISSVEVFENDTGKTTILLSQTQAVLSVVSLTPRTTR